MSGIKVQGSVLLECAGVFYCTWAGSCKFSLVGALVAACYILSILTFAWPHAAIPETLNLIDPPTPPESFIRYLKKLP